VAKTDSPRTRREREAERLRAAEQARAEAMRRAARRRGIIGIGVVVGVVLAVVGVIKGASGEQERKAATTSTSAGPTTTSTAAPVSLPPAPPGSDLAGAPPCPPPGGSPTRVTRFEAAPPDCLAPDREYTAEVFTSKGQLTVNLQVEGPSRPAVNAFVFLARYHYYDGLPVSMVRRGAWAEVGDPAGGPGFRLPTVAGANQANVFTSLLFGMTPRSGTIGGGLTIGMPGDQVTTIAPDTTAIGLILDARTDRSPGAPDDQRTVLQEINDAASATGAPTRVITIDRVEIIEGPKP
jgi:hypothetical protein